MKPTMTSYLLTALLLATPAVLCAAPNPSNHIPPGKVFVYKTSHGQPQNIEVYFPKGHDPAKAKVPGVLLFHGGGWSGGDLSQFRYACDYFARRGLVAATANYYLHPKEEQKALGPGGKRKRVCVTDGISAIRWFKQHAGELGIDPKRIVLGGGSAGGHIAMMATLNRRLDDPSDPTNIDTSVIGFLLFNPAFTTKGRDNDDEVDVFTHLKPGIAPSLFMFGEKDAWKAASDELVPALRKSGAQAKMFVADGVSHSFWMRPEWYDCCLVECDRFLVSLGLLKGEALLRKPAGTDFNPQKSSLSPPQPPASATTPPPNQPSPQPSPSGTPRDPGNPHGATFNLIFTSGMVLQRDAKVRIYGEGDDGEQVTMTFKGQTRSAKVEKGAWEVFLDPMKADCNGAEMALSSRSGTNKLNGILVGDVWVLGGQSNMYRGFHAFPPLKDSMEKMNEPLIRIFFVDPNIKKSDQRTTRFKTLSDMGWTAAVYNADEKTKEFLKGISPAGYFFACNLVKGKQVPVGLIMACLGSTSAQDWTPHEVLQNNPMLRQYLADDEAIKPDAKRPYMAHTSWLYNGVVYPIARFTIKGVLWYQGESNAKQAENYRILFPEMIKAWRRDWGQGDFPFIFAQLASYDGVGWDKLGCSWAVLRESQSAALSLPNTGMITLIDAGEAGDIHPADKQTTGYRFYMKARQVAYDEGIIASGPVFSSVKKEGDAMRIIFNNVGEGLVLRQVSMPKNNTSRDEFKNDPVIWLRSPVDKLVGFTICGADQKFVPAEAEIVSKDSVLVRSPDVPNPVAVRYAWANFSLANLYNKEGFSTEPFRTDKFKLPPPDAFFSKKGH